MAKEIQNFIENLTAGTANVVTWTPVVHNVFSWNNNRYDGKVISTSGTITYVYIKDFDSKIYTDKRYTTLYNASSGDKIAYKYSDSPEERDPVGQRDMYNTFDNTKVFCPYEKPDNVLRWDYGNNVNINIDLTDLAAKPEPGQHIDPSFLINKKVVANFYNFRYEPVFIQEFVYNKGEITVDLVHDTIGITIVITSAVSAKYFHKGVYFTKFNLEGDNDLPNRDVETIIDDTKYIFEVM